MVVAVVCLFAYAPTNTTDRGCKIQLLTLHSAITQHILCLPSLSFLIVLCHKYLD